MDYEFFFDDSSLPIAVFSTGHEAIATYLNMELNTVPATQKVLDAIDKLEARKISQYQAQGREFQLRLSAEGAEFIANSLGYEIYEELPEHTELYDQELQAECGLLDFQQALCDWQDFIADKCLR